MISHKSDRLISIAADFSLRKKNIDERFLKMPEPKCFSEISFLDKLEAPAFRQKSFLMQSVCEREKEFIFAFELVLTKNPLIG